MDYGSLFHNENFESIKKKMKAEDSEIICRNCHESISEKKFNAIADTFNKDYSKDSIALSIIELYQTLLGRFPDKVGFDFFHSKISNNEFTVHEVKSQIKQSSEYAAIHPPSLSLNSS